jgi:SNF family Na+-dependent transporter
MGMGSIHCYASYLGRNSDVALNAAAAGWTNEFVEVVIGSAIIIPIATAYLGLAAVQGATAGGNGFGLGFLALPTLFNNWGALAPIAGVMWFGLLFFAGITSSLAMGQPLMAFMEDEYAVKRGKAALIFGAGTLLLGLFCVMLYPGGAFDEFDFWSGTFALVVFAVFEAFIFTRIFGIEKGWGEITRGADMAVPKIFKFVIAYVTPVFILLVFVGAMIQPTGEWGDAISSLLHGGGWPFAPQSVVGRVFHVGDASYTWFENGHVTRAMVQDVTRLLLLTVLGCIAVLVRNAWRRRGRAES